MSASTVTLAQLPIGRKASVARVEGSGAVTQRLAEMGMVPGAVIEVVRTAPLGDPIEVRLEGYHLSVRRTEAALIIVRRCVGA